MDFKRKDIGHILRMFIYVHLCSSIFNYFQLFSIIFNYFHLSSILDIDAIFSEWQDSLRYVVQVAAVTAAGRGPWSEQPLSRIAAFIFLGLTSGYYVLGESL